MSENLSAYTLEDALKVIEKCALSLPAGLVAGPNSELHLPPLPPEISNVVPKDLVSKNISHTKWEGYAYAFYRVIAFSDNRVEAARIVRELVKAWDEQQKFMHKGKDGKDYESFEEARYSDEIYVEQESPDLSSRKR